MTTRRGGEELFQAALSAMQSGQFESAISLCNQLISDHGSSGDVLHVLALSHRSLEDYSLAEQAIRRSTKKSPNNASIRNTYGLILLDSDAPNRAEAQFRKAIKIEPRLAAAHANLGHALVKVGKSAEAKKSYLRALNIDPSFTDAFVHLALLQHSAGNVSEVKDLLDVFLDSNPHSAATYFVEGSIAFHEDNFSRAEDLYRSGLDLEPSARPLLMNLGITLTKQAKTREAIGVLEKANTLFPDDPEIQVNLANALKYAAPEHAQGLLESALQRAPHDLNALDLLGFCLMLQRNTPRAIEVFDSALRLDSSFQRAKHHKACALFLEGRLAEAWPLYTSWYGDSGLGGSPIGMTLGLANEDEIKAIPTLVWTDQGIGDEMLQLSMVADIVGDGAPLILATSPRLVPLVQRSFPNILCISRDELSENQPLTINANRQFPAGALGLRTRPSLTSFPSRQSFLKADEAISAKLRERYRALSHGNPVVGLSWKSSNSEFGGQKSIPLTMLEPLLAQSQLSFVNLQYGDTEQEVNCLPDELKQRLFKDAEADPLTNLDRFAAQVMAVDLVITTSNSTAHLAGALGKETWIFVPRPGPGWLWYWFLDRQDSPWYPSCTLFRQGADGDWNPAIEAVAKRVGEFFS